MQSGDGEKDVRKIKEAGYEGGSNLPVTVRTAQTTPYGPALIVAGHGGAFMSWTGTDAAQSVNVSAENF